MNIDFVFDNEVENFENNYEQDFTAIIEQALKTLGIEDDVEVSCVLVDDEYPFGIEDGVFDDLNRR